MKELINLEIREGCNYNESFYKGAIQKYQLTKVLGYYGLNISCTQDFDLDLDAEEESALYLFINLAEKSGLRLTCKNSKINIPAFSSLLVPFKVARDVSFKCQSAKDYNLIVLKIHKSHLDEGQMQLLKDLEDEKLFLNAAALEERLMPNLAICEVARKLKALDKESSENKLLARGYGNILIGMKLKEFSTKSSGIVHTLRNYEIQQLERITEQIKENPQNQYNIDSLCKITGLSVSKLQAGFKEMHQCTVAIFIRNVRLEKALQMLHETNLNVSEIVYSVGLSSRSYFCRIFKNRFKCSPKIYQQKLRQHAAAVS